MASSDILAAALDLVTAQSGHLKLALSLREEALRMREDLRPRGDLEMSADALITPETETILIEALRTAKADIRGLIAATLGDIGGADSIPALQTSLMGDDLTFARTAAGSLAQIGGHSAVLLLLEVAANSTSDTTLRLSALTALEALATKQATFGSQVIFEDLDRERVDKTYQMAEVLLSISTDTHATWFLRLKAAEILDFWGQPQTTYRLLGLSQPIISRLDHLGLETLIDHLGLETLIDQDRDAGKSVA